jgi:hypothetical protein
MERFFEQSQKMIADELGWFTKQFTDASARLVSESERWMKMSQDTFGRIVEQQTSLVTEAAKHAQGLAEQQAKLVREAFAQQAA